MSDEHRLTFIALQQEANKPISDDGVSEDLEEACARYLQARGYRVVGRSIATKLFPCNLGHIHKTADAKEKCEHSQASFTGKSREELANKMNEEARPRYEKAYKDFAGGATKTEVSRSLGVTRGRADQIIKRGWRYAITDGWATKVP